MLSEILFLLMLPETLRCINGCDVSSEKLHSFNEYVMLSACILWKEFAFFINVIFMSVFLLFRAQNLQTALAFAFNSTIAHMKPVLSLWMLSCPSYSSY